MLRAILLRLWAAPTTAVGLLVLLLTLPTGGRVRVHTGVLEVCGGLAAWMLRRVRASAMALGHVVLAVDDAAHDRSRDHERVHVRQAERLGPLFLPAYGLASLTAWLAGRHYYYGNRYEIEAYGRDKSREVRRAKGVRTRPRRR